MWTSTVHRNKLSILMILICVAYSFPLLYVYIVRTMCIEYIGKKCVSLFKKRRGGEGLQGEPTFGPIIMQMRKISFDCFTLHTIHLVKQPSIGQLGFGKKRVTSKLVCICE